MGYLQLTGQQKILMAQNINLRALSVPELRHLISLAKQEIQSRPDNDDAVDTTKLINQAYKAYNSIVLSMGPQANTLDLRGWSRDSFASYIMNRTPPGTRNQIPVVEIMDEERDHRNAEWLKARTENRPPNYTDLTHVIAGLVAN
jgi:hypothetical protein